jgi:hypothetical protein
VRLPEPVARYLGLTLQRLGARISASSSAPQSAVAQARLNRARAALADARLHMPGLLGMAMPDAVETSPDAEPQPASGALVDASSFPLPVEEGEGEGAPEPDLRLARVEEVVLRLEEERRQLRAEVVALRLIAEELRETLIRLDETAAYPRPAPPAGEQSDQEQEPAAAPSPALAPPEPVYPAGSVGIEVQISAVEDAAALERLRLAIARQPEVDSVRVVCTEKDEATLRLYLRFPMGRRAFIDLLGRAAPSAKPLSGPAPATLLLRLRPS